jgi:hypothetical protein
MHPALVRIEREQTLPRFQAPDSNLAVVGAGDDFVAANRYGKHMH